MIFYYIIVDWVKMCQPCGLKQYRIPSFNPARSHRVVGRIMWVNTYFNTLSYLLVINTKPYLQL